jgi:hypothetical protein
MENSVEPIDNRPVANIEIMREIVKNLAVQCLP